MPKARFSSCFSRAFAFALLLALALIQTSPAHGMDRAFGWSRILATGAPAPNATITVRNAGTATLSSLFSDNGVTVKANPFTADSSGYWFFYAANGRYDITLSGGGIVSPYTLSDYVLTDAGGIASICGVSGTAISLATSTTGTDFSLTCSDPGDSITYNLPSASATARGLVTTGAQTIAGAKTFSTPIAAGSGGTGVNASAAANGRLLIGNGTGFTLAGLAGTANQIAVTNGVGSITLATPQDIGVASSPTFFDVTANGNIFNPGQAIGIAAFVDGAGSIAGVELGAGELLIGGGPGIVPTPGALGAGPGISVAGSAGAITITNNASLNGLSFGAFPAQTFAAGTGGSDFSIASSGGVHTFSLPNASSTARGLISTGTQTIAGGKTFSGQITPLQGIGGPSLSGTNANAAGNPFLAITPTLGTGTGTTGLVDITVGLSQASGTTPHTSVSFERWRGGTLAEPTANEAQLVGTHGEQWFRGVMTELVTLSTVGATTNTTNNLLPADAIIQAVTTRVTTTISGGGVTAFSVGDSTTAARFSASAGGLTSGSTRVGLAHMSGAVTTLAAGPTQSAAATIRITCDATPTAGVVRITIYYMRFVAPTS